ncbi:MAG: hypothetical protein IJ646_06040 [Clostridia bacterium]|nr:hypothetical protein [Clostridia bacterium]
MERFLTKKGQHAAIWEYLVMVASGLMMIGFIRTGVHAYNPENPAASIAATATLTLLAAVPLILALVMRERRGTAKLLAAALYRQPDGPVRFDRMDDLTGVKDAAWKVYQLTNQGYMRNIGIDQKGKTVRLGDG